MQTSQQQSNQLKISAQGSDDRCAWIDVVMLGSERTVSPSLAKLLTQRYPTLIHHACKNSCTVASSTFGECLVGAMLPHAAEHLAIELLVKDYPGEVFAGNTAWLSREDNTMRVRVSLPKNASADATLGALSEAIAQLSGLISAV